jgi:hypothetical protein
MSAKVSTISRVTFLTIGAATAIAAAGGAVAQYEAVQPPLGTSATAPTSTPSAATSPPPTSATPTPATPANSSAAPSPAPTNGTWWTDLFAYPKGGQSVDQQNRDRRECRAWAVSQSNFDPVWVTQDSPKEYAAQRDNYLRAESACLLARNYSVK